MKKVPDSLVIIFVVMFLFAGLSWLVPAGEFERALVNGRNVVVPGTYHTTGVEANPQGFWDWLMAPIKGFMSASEIVGFVLLVGGAFTVVTGTGAIDAFLLRILRIAKDQTHYKNAVIILLMFIFSLGGMSFGMSEETLVFVLVTIPLARSLGYDNFVGVAIPFIAAGVGFAGAAFNPFTVAIAQGIAELPTFSGWQYRLVVWFGMTLIAIVFVLVYANRIHRDPSRSLLKHLKLEFKPIEEVPLTSGRVSVLLLFLLALAAVMYGAVALEWYIPEICALFILLAMTSAAVTRMGTSAMIKHFYTGAKDMLPAALVIACSKAILVLAEDGKIIDTVLYHTAGLVEGLPTYLSVQVMFLVHGGINFFIPSGSGQAAVTMPLMTPLADLMGITRQTAVLAFQFGDGLFNFVIPTSGILMGILSIAGIPFNLWIKWVWKLFLLLVLAGMFFLALPTLFFEWN